MSDAPTLYSRLRVLVAKTFRASQLYASMRSQPEARDDLSELANDIRADVWYRSHNDFHQALKDVLSLRGSSQMMNQLIEQKRQFEKRVESASRLLEHKTGRAIDCAQRQEFASALKINVELIRHKAQMQANRVIADELANVLSGQGRGRHDDEMPVFGNLDVDDPMASDAPPSNVIPLRQRAAGGQKSRSR